HRHPRPQHPDRPRVLGHLAGAVDDDVVQRRRQRIDGLAVPQQADVGERAGHHVEPLCRSALEPPRHRPGYARPHDYTVTPTLPICWFDSRKRWASTILSSGNALATSGLRLPSASPSFTNSFARSRRAGSLVISIIT